MGDTVLSVATRAVLGACERLGLDGDALLAAAALKREEVLDPDARIAAQGADALWQCAYQRAGDPFLALHAAEALPFGAYRVIDYLASHSDTLGAALGRLASYFEIVDTRAKLEVSSDGALEVAMSTASGAPVPGPAQDYTFAAVVTRLRPFVERFDLEVVELAAPAPPITSEHERIFGAQVLFDRPRPLMRWSPGARDARLRSADPHLLAILEAHAGRVRAELPRRDDTIASRAREACTEELRAQRGPTLSSIAKVLAVSDRTLQRRLADEGTSFGAVLDDARSALARAFIRDREVSLAEVAWLLGFSDQSTFTRAFKRWTGAAPGEWRKTA